MHFYLDDVLAWVLSCILFIAILVTIALPWLLLAALAWLFPLSWLVVHAAGGVWAALAAFIWVLILFGR